MPPLWSALVLTVDNGLANRKLGDQFFNGRGVKADLKMASKYYTAAVTFGDAQSAFNIGFMHHRGNGLHKDLHLAKRYIPVIRTFAD